MHCSSPGWTLPGALHGVVLHSQAADKPPKACRRRVSANMVCRQCQAGPSQHHQKSRYAAARVTATYRQPLEAAKTPQPQKMTSGDNAEWHQKLHAPGVREWQGNPAPCNEGEGSQIMHRALRERAKGHAGEEKRGKKIANRQYQKCVTEIIICKPRLGLENFILAEEQNLSSRFTQLLRFPEHKKWPKRKMLIISPAPWFWVLPRRVAMGNQPRYADWDQQSQQARLAGKYTGK